MVLILATCCFAKRLQPAHHIPLHPHMCSNSLCSFRFLLQLLPTTAECQITYGKHTQLLLQLMVLQSFKEGMVLGVLSKVPDYGIIFPVMESFMLNFLVISTSSTPIKSYVNAHNLRLLAMMGQLCMRIMLLWVLLKIADVTYLSSGLYK